MTDRYAVVGNPIGHSKSPQIHARFAQLTGESLVYDRLEAPLAGFEQSVTAFFNQGGKGLNVTVPFKQQAWEMVDHRSVRAEKAGAVNTLYQSEGGELHGDNTDGVGLVRDLIDNQGITLANQRILILGAGGAVRGVLGPLLAEGPAELTIANRTLSRAQTLAQLFSDEGSVSCCAFDEALGPFDLIINGTSASLGGELPPLADSVVASHTCAYDMMYSPDTTVFNTWAQSRGAACTVDGLGMLVEQAAESFRVWRGVLPPTDTVIRELRMD